MDGSRASTETGSPALLEGVRVLDFSRVLAGPYCTALVADLGAEVIKIESPSGDDYRHVGPFQDGESLLFQTVNRGKRSIALDLKDPQSVEHVRALVRSADVLVENFRPGVMEKLGFGWEAMHALNPRLVYVSISGFGQTGPNVNLPAYDIIIQAMSGLMALTGSPDGPPTMVGEAVADVAGGLFGAWGMMVALFARERTGVGRHVDLALFDALLATMPTAACRTLMTDTPLHRTGNRHPLSAPFGVYTAGQGHFAVAVLNDRLFQTFCAAIGQEKVGLDPRFASDTLRRQNEPALAEIIEAWAGGFTAAEVVAALAAAGIPASEIQGPAHAWTSEQAQARGLCSPVAHPLLGDLQVPEQPVHFSGASRGRRAPAPKLNADADDILGKISTTGAE